MNPIRFGSPATPHPNRTAEITRVAAELKRVAAELKDSARFPSRRIADTDLARLSEGLTYLLNENRQLREALVMLNAAAADTDRNMREADGRCMDCGRHENAEHDDPDCGMSILAVMAREALAALKEQP